MSCDDIRQRLADVEHIDWSKVEHQTNEDHNGDWLHIDDKVLLYDDPDAEAVVEFMKRAPADLRRLLADLDHATTTRKAVMPTNPVYGPPPDPERGEPARHLADAIKVQRPNGDVVVMDLVALADAAINAERAVAGLREENEQLRARVEELERKASRAERAGRVLAGVVDPENVPNWERDPLNRETVEDLANRVRELEQAAQRQEDYEREMRERGDA